MSLPALPLKGSVPEPTAPGRRSSLPQSLMAWGSLTASPGLDAGLEIINAINIHNKRPGEMMRVIICPPLGPRAAVPPVQGAGDPHRQGRCQAPSPSTLTVPSLGPHTSVGCGWGLLALFCTMDHRPGGIKQQSKTVPTHSSRNVQSAPGAVSPPGNPLPHGWSPVQPSVGHSREPDRLDSGPRSPAS